MPATWAAAAATLMRRAARDLRGLQGRPPIHCESPLSPVETSASIRSEDAGLSGKPDGTTGIAIAAMLIRESEDMLHKYTARATSRPPSQRVDQDCKKASRSALIVSAWVVGMPCGNPWYVLSVPLCTSSTDSGAESS
jgi:hypothetical protein